MAINNFEAQLTGGHPNSLGNTLNVVDEVLENKNKLQSLFDCYKSTNAVVRLRVSNAIKRICKEKPEWIAEHLNDLTGFISKIDQASTKWTLSTLFMWLDDYMTQEHREMAIKIMKDNLLYDDWIVQNTTAESLAHFARSNDTLKQWLQPKLEILLKSRHKSVANRAKKILSTLV